MVQDSSHSASDWWPQLTDPLRRWGSKVADFFTPVSDASHTEDAYILEIELPGVKDEDIHVELHGDVLSIRGEKRSDREEKGKTYYFSERTFGSFQRSFRVPPDVDENSVQAEVSDGVLTLKLGRMTSPTVEKRKIEVNRKK